MGHNTIYEWFCSYFPQYSKYVELGFPNDKNSIRVRQTNGAEFIFTYNSSQDWRFETIKSFLKKGDE